MPRFWLVPVLLAAGDVVATVACFLLAIALRERVLPAVTPLPPFEPVAAYASLWPVLALLVVVRAGTGLYPGYGRSAASELRLQTLATALVVAFVLVGSVLFRFAETFSRIVLVGTFLLMILALPLVRAWLKTALARTPIYGVPVVLLGRGERRDAVQSVLTREPSLGLRVASQPEARRRARHCLWVPGADDAMIGPLLDELNRRYRRVWLVPHLGAVASVWVAPRDLRGYLALEIRNNLLERRNRWAKRLVDLVIVAAALPIVLPLGLIVAVIVRLDSPGPALIRHRRVGRGGAFFEVLKFRTMYRNADAVLADLLRDDPSLRAEWEERQKLQRDPRITRMGRLLRRTSLDELPQLWNVVRGEMSIVGPRPIVEAELKRYGDDRAFYLQLTPGVTGLTQVSGRSDLDYEERVRLDAYYARNWSVWLDLEILARTVKTVVSGRGAY